MAMIPVGEFSLLTNASGRIGKLVVKQYNGKIVLANCPGRSRKKPTEKQRNWRSIYRNAVRSARYINNNPELKAAYKINGRRNVFQAALSDFLKCELEEARIKASELHP